MLQAAHWWQQALKQAPQNPVLWNNLGAFELWQLAGSENTAPTKAVLGTSFIVGWNCLHSNCFLIKIVF